MNSWYIRHNETNCGHKQPSSGPTPNRLAQSATRVLGERRKVDRADVTPLCKQKQVPARGAVGREAWQIILGTWRSRSRVSRAVLWRSPMASAPSPEELQ